MNAYAVAATSPLGRGQGARRSRATLADMPITGRLPAPWPRIDTVARRSLFRRQNVLLLHIGAPVPRSTSGDSRDLGPSGTGRRDAARGGSRLRAGCREDGPGGCWRGSSFEGAPDAGP